MGWIWGESSPKETDPTKQLDSGLQNYLEKEAPAKYTPTTTIEPPPQPTSSQTSSQGLKEQATPPQPAPEASTDPTDDKPTVPNASLFPDGRYSHLWKGYQPLSEIEGVTLAKAEQAVDQSKRQKDVLNRAALENCSVEHEGLSTCYQTGDFQQRMKARMTMCRAENREFSKCYTMQAKFLQTLGYGAAMHWDEDREERIQMHADKLYHQMIDYEARVAEAKEAGREPPPIRSLFNPSAKPLPPSANDGNIEIPGGETLPQGTKFQKPLKDMTPHERELEVQSIKQQMAQRQLYMKEVTPILKAESDAKAKRREKLSGWFGETVGKWLA